MPHSNDKIHRFLFENSDIRGEIITLTDAFRDASSAQNLPSQVKTLFGEFLAGAALISEILKFDGLITLQARGDGVIPLIMAESNHQGDVRGVVNTEDGAQLLTDDTRELKALPELIGQGVLALTLDPKQGQRYQGIVPLDGAKLEDCLMSYFEQSEQVPTFLLLFANENKCGGLFLQCLPSQNSEQNTTKEDQWQTICQLASTMQSDEFFEEDHETILYRLFHEQECRIFEPKAIQYKCSCSKTRSIRALASLSSDELEELASECHPIEVDCQFCGTQYQIDIEELRAAVNAERTTLH